MTGLGDRLKEARMEKGYTLDDLQSITKIQKRYLAGIENEEFGSMPGSFYVRAFIKQYADAVGLDADEMLSLYRDSSGAEIEEERQLTSSQPLARRSSAGRNQLNEVMPKIIFALFIIVIFGVIWFLWNASNKPEPEIKEDPITIQDQNKPNDDKQGDQSGAGNEDGNDAEVDEEPDPEPEPEPEQVLENISVAGENSTYSLTNAEEFLLEVRTTGGSWIGVLDSDRVERTPGARIMNAGESIELDVSDTDSVRIRVGRPQSTEIYVNGELLEYASNSVPQNIIIEYEKEE